MSILRSRVPPPRSRTAWRKVAAVAVVRQHVLRRLRGRPAARRGGRPAWAGTRTDAIGGARQLPNSLACRRRRRRELRYAGYRAGLVRESRKSVTAGAKAGPSWGTCAPPFIVHACTVDPPAQPDT